MVYLTASLDPSLQIVLTTLRDHQKTLERVRQLETELAELHQELDKVRSHAPQTNVVASPAGEDGHQNEEAV